MDAMPVYNMHVIDKLHPLYAAFERKGPPRLHNCTVARKRLWCSPIHASLPPMGAIKWTRSDAAGGAPVTKGHVSTSTGAVKVHS